MNSWTRLIIDPRLVGLDDPVVFHRTSIYNLPLCLLEPSVWHLAAQSISDWKNEFLPECAECAAKSQCAGFFSSADLRQSSHIRALTSVPGTITTPPPVEDTSRLADAVPVMVRPAPAVGQHTQPVVSSRDPAAVIGSNVAVPHVEQG